MKRRAARGSEVVESSIVLLVFMVVFVGILDMGQLMFLCNVLSDRVRTGARYAVVHTYSTATIQNVVAYNSSTSPGGSGLFGITPAMVQVNHYDAGLPTERVQVAISTYTMHFLSPWLASSFTPGPFSAVMPMESGGAAQ
jgi:hypothetical protein